MKYGVEINHREMAKCGALTCAGGVTGLLSKAREWNSLEDANEFISAQGWKNDVSVPDYGITAYAFQLPGSLLR
jgi:hypothetical protein